MTKFYFHQTLSKLLSQRVDTDKEKEYSHTQRNWNTKMFLRLLHIATFEVVQIFWFIWFCKFPVGMKCANYIFWTHMFFFWDFTEQRNRMNAVRFLSCKINNTNNPFLKIFINNEGSSHYCFWEFQISWWLLNRR